MSIDAIVVALSDDSPLTTSESLVVNEANARKFIASLRIKRLTDHSFGPAGHYSMTIEYDSMLMGARATFLSRDLRKDTPFE